MLLLAPQLDHKGHTKDVDFSPAGIRHDGPVRGFIEMLKIWGRANSRGCAYW
jgi:hypothetical protein